MRKIVTIKVKEQDKKEELIKKITELINNSEIIIFTNDFSGIAKSPTKKKDHYQLPNPILAPDSANDLMELMKMKHFMFLFKSKEQKERILIKKENK